MTTGDEGKVCGHGRGLRGRAIPLWLLAIASVVWTIDAMAFACALLLRALGVLEEAALLAMAWMLFTEFALRKPHRFGGNATCLVLQL